MNEAPSPRRLAAILAADVVGYSRMMAQDEAGTLAALKRFRADRFDPEVARHGGRIFKLIGDGTLVEFASVVDAVRCAVAIQMAGQAGIVLRIGINLGDVLVDGDDLYGDGVNVAARLEQLAEPGGLCVAGVVADSVANRVEAAFSDGGEVRVKNIDRPIRVYSWAPGGASTPAKPSQPAIAVLPFDNMSGDPEQEYFSDGISEDIITDLSKAGGLMVIARNSSFTYKGRSTDIRTVGRELGVTAVLEGSIRKAGNRVRITAQLIDTANGAHLWADRYDRELTDIFAVQDEVTRQIVAALKVRLTPVEAARIAAVPTRNMEAHDLFLRGREAIVGTTNTKETFEYALRCFQRAVDLDADYADAYAGLGHAWNRDFQNRWSGRDDGLKRSVEYAALAIAKAPELPYAHFIVAASKFWERDLAGSLEAADRAVELNPNFLLALTIRASALMYAGRPLEAVSDLKRGLRLDPLTGHLAWHFLGSAWLLAGEYEQAVDAFRERVRMMPATDLSRGFLVAALGLLGRLDEARAVRDELAAINPGYSFAAHLARLPFPDPAPAERLKQGYIAAGIPD